MTLSASQWPNPAREFAGAARCFNATCMPMGEPWTLLPACFLRLRWAAGQVAGQTLPVARVRVDPSVDALRAHAHHGVVRMFQMQPARDQQGREPAAQPFLDPYAQLVVRHMNRSPGQARTAYGLALRGPGHVAPARPRPGLEPCGPVGAVRLVPVGRETRVAFDLTTHAGWAAPRHGGHHTDRSAIAHLDLDYLPFLLADTRIHSTHGCNTFLQRKFRQSPILEGVVLVFRQREAPTSFLEDM